MVNRANGVCQLEGAGGAKDKREGLVALSGKGTTRHSLSIPAGGVTFLRYRPA